MTYYFHESDGTAYRVDPGGVNLGLAVDVERPDGSRLLVVPVIKGMNGMDADFVGRCRDLVERARSGGLSPDDMAGATIALTNPGTLGTTASVTRLMPNQGAFVATSAIRDTGARTLMTVHLHLRPGHPGRRVGQLPAPARRLAGGHRRLLFRCVLVLAADFAKAPPVEAAGEPAARAGVRPLAASSAMT